MPHLTKTLEQHWSLFEDWCEAFDKPCTPTTIDTLVEFLRAFPSGVPTNTLRVRAIRYQQENHGTPLDLNALRTAAGLSAIWGLFGTPTLMRSGPGTTQTVAETLAQLPKAHHGKSVA